MLKKRVSRRLVVATVSAMGAVLLSLWIVGIATAADQGLKGIQTRLSAIEAKLDSLRDLVQASGGQIMLGQGVAAKKAGDQYNCNCNTSGTCPHGNHYVCAATVTGAQGKCELLCAELMCGAAVATLGNPLVDCADVAEAVSGLTP